MTIVIEHPQRVPRSSDRVIAGVAGGYADRWRVEPTVVRSALAVLTLVGGVGLVIYAVLWLNSTPPEPRRVTPLPLLPRRHLAIGAGVAATLVGARGVGLWPGDAIMLPATAVAVGTSLAWTMGSGHAVPGAAQHSRSRRATLRATQVVAALALLAGGVWSLADRTGGLAGVGASASAIAVVIGGIVMFAAPAAGRLLRALDDERALRIREDERAAVAAHLHDSVLQSLVLIQRADDPRRMVTLARRQERELRSWLYGTSRAGEPASLHAAIDAVTVAIEDEYDLRVEAVVVGDRTLDHASRTLVAALREALVNAGHHAGVDHVDVFVEADDTELTGFVRDSGRGFDHGAVPSDRRGISESIVGRVRRVGGTALVVSQPSVGTEVEIRIPVSGRAGARP